MRPLALLAMTGCITSIHPRGGTLETTPPRFEGVSQLGSFSLSEALTRDHVVIVFYRGFW
jgi:hypothetical protein